MKRNQFSKKLISMAASMAIAMSAAAQLCITPVSAADTGTEIGQDIQNGSFEAPDIAKVASNYGDKITTEVDAGNEISYRKEGWMVTSESTFNEVSGNNFHWDTTASNERIEIVKADETGDAYFPSGTDHLAAHGNQFAELVAEEESSLYQNITTTPESTLTWSISHRARVGTTANGKNSMAVFVGPKQEGLKKSSKTSNDIFKQMAMLLYTNIDELDVGVSQRAVKLYSVPVKDGMEVTSDSVSKEPSTKYDQEWFCWIITSDTKQWYEYSDTYKVPEDQTETTLAFAALNGGTDGQPYINTGNLIDDVRFGVMYPLNVSTTPGGRGVVEYLNDDILSEDNVKLENSPYIKNLEKGTGVTIKAVPDTSVEDKTYKFIGARIDGKIVNVNATDDISGNIFKDEGGGSYSFDLTMDQVHHVVLFFALTGKVTYAPNGGTFEGAADGYITEVDYGVQKVYESSDNWTVTQNEKPINGEKTFAGWTIVSDNEVYFVNENDEKPTDYNGEFIPPDHTVGCTENDDQTFTYTITYTYGDENKTLIANSSDRTLLFVAEYYNTLNVISCYVGVDKITEHNDKAGGIATVSIDASEPSESVSIYSGQQYTLKATAKTGYEFKGWYLQISNDPDDVKPITETDPVYTANFSSNTDVTIHAMFVEIEVNPKLAVVAQDAEAKAKLDAKDIINTITNFDDGYGGNVYGNTISTSFTLTRDFSGYTTDDIGGVWTVVLPTLGTYMKVSENDGVNYQYIDTNDPVVEDKDVKYNSGTIYGTQEGLNTTDQFQFYVHSSTTVTNGTAVFGLVIDNVYAPNATAGFKVTNGNTENLGELGDNNSIYTNYGSGESYQHDEDKLNGPTSVAGE